jgi:predicted AAA+ superfamily ATPase
MNNNIIQQSFIKNNPNIRVISHDSEKVHIKLPITNTINPVDSVVCINAPLGLGKTTFIKDHIITNPKYSQILYLSPTRALTKSSAELLGLELSFNNAAQHYK